MGVVSSIGNAISSGVQSVGSDLSNFDKSVRNTVPGGWTTLGTIAAAVAAPYAAPELFGTGSATGLTSGQLFQGASLAESLLGGNKQAQQTQYPGVGLNPAASTAGSKSSVGVNPNAGTGINNQGIIGLTGYSGAATAPNYLEAMSLQPNVETSNANVPTVQNVPTEATSSQLNALKELLSDDSGYSKFAVGGMATGGIQTLGSYSDGGQLLKGPGDGMSDDIPAKIGQHQPARLADGEFVVPADVVSHLGNGSTDAGAKQLYAMMDRIRKARTGNKKQGKQINPAKFLP